MTPSITRDQANALVKHLATTYKCHTILLFGSHADGGARPDSDWNLFGIRADGPSTQVRVVWHQAVLDLTLFNEKDPQGLGTRILPLRHGLVLAQKGKIGDMLIQQARALYGQGAPKPDLKQAELMRDETYKQFNRQGDPLEMAANRLVVLSQTPQIYCRMRSIWFEGMRRFSADLKKYDPASYALFVQAMQHGPFSAPAAQWLQQSWNQAAKRQTVQAVNPTQTQTGLRNPSRGTTQTVTQPALKRKAA